MGRHNRPGDPAQNDVETVELPAVPSHPHPPVSGRHGGAQRATWRAYLFPPEEARHVNTRRARGHRRAPLALHAAVGAVFVFAVSVSIGMAAEGTVDTVQPETAPVEGRFVSQPKAGVGRAPVTFPPVARKTGQAASPSRPVTGRPSRPTTSQSPREGTPERPRRTGTPSVSPSPGGGSPGSPTTAPADPATDPSPVLDAPWGCLWTP